MRSLTRIIIVQQTQHMTRGKIMGDYGKSVTKPNFLCNQQALCYY